jgi:quercetin dioxygenase-like cupin family protein
MLTMNWTATLAAAAALTLTTSFSTLAQDDPAAAGVSREEVLASATNMVGKPIAYPSGAARVTAEMVSFEPGGHTALHTHPVPSFVYVLEGELEVRIEGQEPMRFRPGQAFMEPQDTSMQAFNVAEGSTRLVVVYSGSEGGQNMVPVTQ